MRRAPASAPAASEKKPDYLRGLVFADASGHLRLGVEWRWREACVAPLGVGGAIYYPAYLRPGEGAGAHDARLEGDVESAVVKVFGSETLGSGRYGNDLGVRGDISEPLSLVVPAAYHHAAADYDRPYGDLALRLGQPGGAVRIPENLRLCHHISMKFL